MNRHHSFISVFISTVVVMLIFLVYGCSSSGSDTTGPGPSPSGPPNGSLFDSGHISAGGSFSYTFANNDTTVAYFCQIHAPNMKGKVIVKTGAAISGQDTVVMMNQQFNPSSVTVAPNTKIVWVNHDGFDHTVTNGSPSTSSGSGGGGTGY